MTLVRMPNRIGLRPALDCAMAVIVRVTQFRRC